MKTETRKKPGPKPRPGRRVGYRIPTDALAAAEEVRVHYGLGTEREAVSAALLLAGRAVRLLARQEQSALTRAAIGVENSMING